MATFNGSSIFGYGKPKMRMSINPRDRQVNAYPGLNNLEALDGGARGAVTTVEGLLYGASLADLNAAIAAILGYWDGNAYVLVDNFGNNWPNVVLHRYEPAGEVMGDQSGRFFQRYTAEFLHLNTG